MSNGVKAKKEHSSHLEVFRQKKKKMQRNIDLLVQLIFVYFHARLDLKKNCKMDFLFEKIYKLNRKIAFK